MKSEKLMKMDGKQPAQKCLALNQGGVVSKIKSNCIVFHQPLCYITKSFSNTTGLGTGTYLILLNLLKIRYQRYAYQVYIHDTIVYFTYRGKKCLTLICQYHVIFYTTFSHLLYFLSHPFGKILWLHALCVSLSVSLCVKLSVHALCVGHIFVMQKWFRLIELLELFLKHSQSYVLSIFSVKLIGVLCLKFHPLGN